MTVQDGPRADTPEELALARARIAALEALEAERERAAKAGQILLSQRANAIVEDFVMAEPVGEPNLKGCGRPVPP